MGCLSLHLTLGKGLTAMYYTKGSIQGFSNDTEVLKFEFKTLMADNDIDKILYQLRDSFNEIGESLNFKMTLESEDI